jgi:hypothetical protein
MNPDVNGISGMANEPLRLNPFDHNGECLYCDGLGTHSADCRWLISWKGISYMKLEISREEAIALISLLRNSWAPLDMQKTIYNLVNRIERELEQAEEHKSEL